MEDWGTYVFAEVGEQVEWDGTGEVDAEEGQGWEEQLALYGLERDLGNKSHVLALADEFHFGELATLLFGWLGRCGFWRSSSATLNP